ncbi:hypothetical protein PFICI_01871 [Pestalotiopsis fici W106-1]|uniref:Zn(2)-C6 fungal-type domain-containing protein n=1 Tax=Pestalotiopsis fici (strain W106-1 / CGMCC3.15140) TaxID=1229662 RepID=W3XPQ8_PESFW|nr:uncharacterized protein PFICI_01871 [Pestalotiopsis fici W106-1]ETS88043.1 hypothetical protein PFICI_01871 [Pestalotiopsis fici W106-1]
MNHYPPPPPQAQQAQSRPPGTATGAAPGADPTIAHHSTLTFRAAGLSITPGTAAGTGIVTVPGTGTSVLRPDYSDYYPPDDHQHMISNHPMEQQHLYQQQHHHQQQQQQQQPPHPGQIAVQTQAVSSSSPGLDAGPNAGAMAAAAAAAAMKPIRRRNRMINSCLECRKRKLKCSKTSPACMNCLKAGRDCLYIGPKLDEASQLRLAEIKEKQGSLERQLERDVAKSTTPKSALQQRILADEVEDDYDEDRDLEATPLVALDMTYEDDADGTDEMIDLGVQIGKLRMTERIGGMPRPRLSEELSAGLSGPRSPGPPAGYGGPPSNAMPGGMGPRGGLDNTSDGGVSDASMPDFLRPGSQFLAPGSGFLFGQVIEQPSILSFLPHKSAADRLMAQYFTSVHPIAPCCHRPSLERAYATFWDEVNANYEPRPSTQAVIFAALFSGAVAMDENEIIRELGGFPKGNWMASLKMGTETALSKSNFLRTTKVETMQAFIMYMLPLCRAELSRAHSVLVGAAARMAECMGLHRDGETYGLSPLETHVRRLLWHQLCFLDIRTCEAQGPKPVIRRDDYDTKLPLNCDEDELTHAVVPPAPSDRWTTNTLALIRFEVNEMMRIIWLDRRRLELRKTTLTSVLTKIENFRRRMSEKYDHLLDSNQPIQRYAKCVMYLLTYRLHVMVLHPYHSNAISPMPPRLGSLLITSAILICELAIQLETNQSFRAWAWYLGAYFQYHAALLLATEVYFRPMSPEADRIWACLDYVFGMDRRLPPEIKAQQLLNEIQTKTAVYYKLRKMRGPTSTTRAQTSQTVVGGTSRTNSVASLGGYSQHMSPAPSTKMETMATPPAIPPGMPPAQMPQMVFAGVSDGQALWSLPPVQHESPGSSDTSSVGHTHGLNMAAPPAAAMGNIMDTIDWDTMYALFPNDPTTGGLSIQGYHDDNLGIFHFPA